MSNYILNINKYRASTVPQIVGRVADLPKMPINIELKDGDTAVNLTDAKVEFRGVTPDDKKLIVSSGIVVTNAKTGSLTFTFPKNFYTSPGRFKRAYFVVKRGEKLDSTQDLIIHVIESIDFDLEDSKDIIEGLDQVIKEVTDKMNKETQAMIDAIQKEYDNLEKLLNQQAQNNIAKIDKEIKIAIDESKLRMRQLESEYRGVINNAQSTLNQLNKEMDKIKPYIDETNKIIDKMDTRLKELEKKINDNDLLTHADIVDLPFGVNNILIDSITDIKNNSYNMRSIRMVSDAPKHGELVTIYIKGKLGSDRTSFTLYNSGGVVPITSLQPIDLNDDGIYSKTVKWVTRGSDGTTASNTYINVFQMPNGGTSESEMEWIKIVRHNPGTEWTPSFEDSYLRSSPNIVVDSNFKSWETSKYWTTDGVILSRKDDFIKITPVDSMMKLYNKSTLSVLKDSKFSVSLIAYADKNCSIKVGTYGSAKSVDITTSPTRYFIDNITNNGHSQIPSIFTEGNVIYIKEISFTNSPIAQSYHPSAGDIEIIHKELSELRKIVTALGGS